MRHGKQTIFVSLLLSNIYIYIYIYNNRVCDGGELFYYITKKKHLTEGEASLIMKQMLSSIKYCHENKIIHR